MKLWRKQTTFSQQGRLLPAEGIDFFEFSRAFSFLYRQKNARFDEEYKNVNHILHE
jgi:hypothetical protein